MPQNNFQKGFTDLILQPRDKLKEQSEKITPHIISDKIDATNRLGVYHNNIIGSLSSALCATYPMIGNLVGEAFLKEMARQFIFKHPPRGACLHDYGEGFDDFIQTYAPADSLPYLPDVARFEWALNHAYYAQDDIALPIEHFAAIPPEELADTVLPLRSSATLILSPYPLQALHELCLHDGDAPNLNKDTTTRLMIYRPQLEVKIIPLSEAEFDLLIELRTQTLGNALETILTQHPAFDFSGFLKKHMTLEVFSDKQA